MITIAVSEQITVIIDDNLLLPAYGFLLFAQQVNPIGVMRVVIVMENL